VTNAVKHTAIGIATTAPTSPVCPDGLVPGKRGKRGLVVAIVGLSAICVAPDESQAAAIEAHRAHELELARLHVEALRLQAERERRECASCGVGK
jgi:hypothetical protein